jgi:hypothetical protein
MERWEEGGVEGERKRRAVMNAMIYLRAPRCYIQRQPFNRQKHEPALPLIKEMKQGLSAQTSFNHERVIKLAIVITTKFAQ